MLCSGTVPFSGGFSPERLRLYVHARRYMKYYSPVASSKVTAAAIVMVETVKHILKANA